MKIVLDHTEQLRAASPARINAHFARLAIDAAVMDRVHARKREIAVAVSAGQNAPDTFVAEADLRGLDVWTFADLILSKPDAVALADARELARQRLLLAVETAKSSVEINALLADIQPTTPRAHMENL